MASPYQNEIPRSRINITLDIETNGAKRKKELPLKILALGNFSGKNAKSDAELSATERITINRYHFDDVMTRVNPTLDISIPNTIRSDDSELSIHLDFKKLKDFTPEQLVLQIPELRGLLAMRHLLKDLRANLIDNQQLAGTLLKLVNDRDKVERLQADLEKL